jgi:hypothetical protein
VFTSVGEKADVAISCGSGEEEYPPKMKMHSRKGNLFATFLQNSSVLALTMYDFEVISILPL